MLGADGAGGQHRSRRDARARRGRIRWSSAPATTPMPTSSSRRSRPASTSSPRSRWRRRPRTAGASSTAEARTGRRVDVAFNYRFAPTSRKIRELLAAGRIGEVDLGRLPLVSRHRARRRLLPPLACLQAVLGQPLRAQGDAPLRPPELVDRRRSGAGLRPGRAPQATAPPGPSAACAARAARMPRRVRVLPRHRRRAPGSRRSTRRRRPRTATCATPASSARTSTSTTR